MQLHFIFWHEMGADFELAHLQLKYAIRGLVRVDVPVIRAVLISESLEEEYGYD